MMNAGAGFVFQLGIKDKAVLPMHGAQAIGGVTLTASQRLERFRAKRVNAAIKSRADLSSSLRSMSSGGKLKSIDQANIPAARHRFGNSMAKLMSNQQTLNLARLRRVRKLKNIDAEFGKLSMKAL